MSQTVHLCLYTPWRLCSPRVYFDRSIALTGASTVVYVTRTLDEERGFSRFQADLANGCDTDESADFEFVAQRTGVADIFQHYCEGLMTSASVGSNPLATRIAEESMRLIPEDVRDRCLPCDPTIKVGEHDIWECAEHPDGFLFGRAFFSFQFFGYGTPNNWKEYRRLVFDLPVVREVKAKLEEFAGPMEQCIYWSI